MRQKEYIRYIADKNYDRFLQQGYASAGHNGPHGHLDTPARNTAHYLIIYSYLYKTTGLEKYKRISDCLARYLYKLQEQSKSGAVKCMETDRFDHLNGLIGQGWVIEGLLYYYTVFGVKSALCVAADIYKAQKYDKDLHLWHRIELDGTDIGIDPTYNHQVWFAACASKMLDYNVVPSLDEEIRDFLNAGTERDFRIYNDGMLYHYVNVDNKAIRKAKIKKAIKMCLTPIKSVDPKKFDYKYMERAYHIFDLYGFSILKEHYGDMPIFSSSEYKKAIDYASNIKNVNMRCGVYSAINDGDMFNIFSYSYNSPAFEYPYVAAVNGFENKKVIDDLYDIQIRLMYDKFTKMFTRNNPDIETWNARCYELIRYLDLRGDESE